MKLKLTSSAIPRFATVLVCLVLYIAAAFRFENFASLQVFVNFLSDNAFLGIASVGMTFVILSGGIDLSVGSIIALVSVSTAVLIQHKGWHPLPAALIMLVAGTLFGAFMGTIIQVFDLPPFLVTLAGMFLGRGLAYVTSLESIPIDHPWYSAIQGFSIPLGENAFVGAVPLVYVTMVIIGILIARYTVFGRNVYALGGNEDAAKLMGIPIATTRIGVYAVSGFCSAVAGIVFTMYTASGTASTGVALELDAIAAVVIGGTLLTGGIGGVFGTFVGVLIFGIIQTSIIFQGTLNSWWTKICIAALLLLFIVMQRLIEGGKRDTTH
jgi:simple sugar transport system permease protein